MNTQAHYQWQGDTLLLYCHIQPRAQTDDIVGLHNNRLKIRISAAPVDGEANTHLQQFLARSFGVAKRQVEIRKGDSGRLKTIAIVRPTQLPDPCEIRR